MPRRDLRAAGTMPVIPARCVAIRYEMLAANFASAVAIATILAFWC